MLNIKMLIKGGPVLTFSLPGGPLAPISPSVTSLAASNTEEKEPLTQCATNFCIQPSS